MWIEVFRSGTHTDNKGNQNTYDIDSIARIAENYNEKIKNSPNLKLPLLKGHNQDSEKLGLINQLTLNNDRLLADIDISDQETIAKIKESTIQNVSLALNGLDISHIGLLENELPAIEDLKPIQETIDTSMLETKPKQNDLSNIMNEYTRISKNLSPVSKELSENILSNLKELPEEQFQSISNNFLKLIDDLNKSYLTRQYSQYKSDLVFESELNTNLTSSDRQILHIEIMNQLKRYPELNYEQALLKIIK